MTISGELRSFQTLAIPVFCDESLKLDKQGTCMRQFDYGKDLGGSSNISFFDSLEVSDIDFQVQNYAREDVPNQQTSTVLLFFGVGFG
jgi:hypothetical protein